MTEADFADIVNPTADEIRRWASSKSLEPMQDCDLIISLAEGHDSLFIELAETAGAPKSRFFLRVLCRIVGDAVRSHWNTRSRDRVLLLINQGSASSHPSIKRWLERAHALVEDPSVFHYGLWCGGGDARKKHQ